MICFMDKLRRTGDRQYRDCRRYVVHCSLQTVHSSNLYMDSTNKTVYIDNITSMSDIAAKLSNLVEQLVAQQSCLCDLAKLANFLSVAQLIFGLESISISSQFLALSLSCDPFACP